MKIVKSPEAKKFPSKNVGENQMRRYIEFHRKLALEELARICSAYGVARATEPRMVSDWWGDGMKVMEVSIDTLKGKRVKLRWVSGNQFFVKPDNSVAKYTFLYENDLE